MSNDFDGVDLPNSISQEDYRKVLAARESSTIPVTIGLDVLEAVIRLAKFRSSPRNHAEQAMLVIAQNAANQARLDAEKS